MTAGIREFRKVWWMPNPHSFAQGLAQQVSRWVKRVHHFCNTVTVGMLQKSSDKVLLVASQLWISLVASICKAAFLGWALADGVKWLPCKRTPIKVIPSIALLLVVLMRFIVLFVVTVILLLFGQGEEELAIAAIWVTDGPLLCWLSCSASCWLSRHFWRATCSSDLFIISTTTIVGYWLITLVVV